MYTASLNLCKELYELSGWVNVLYHCKDRTTGRYENIFYENNPTDRDILDDLVITMNKLIKYLESKS